jgi:hypothetical protein
MGGFRLDHRSRGHRLIADQLVPGQLMPGHLLLGQLLPGQLLARHPRAAANGTERLTFGAFDLGRVRSTAAFEVEMLANGVVK